MAVRFLLPSSPICIVTLLSAGCELRDYDCLGFVGSESSKPLTRGDIPQAYRQKSFLSTLGNPHGRISEFNFLVTAVLERERSG